MSHIVTWSFIGMLRLAESLSQDIMHVRGTKIVVDTSKMMDF